MEKLIIEIFLEHNYCNIWEEEDSEETEDIGSFEGFIVEEEELKELVGLTEVKQYNKEPDFVVKDDMNLLSRSGKFNSNFLKILHSVKSKETSKAGESKKSDCWAPACGHEVALDPVATVPKKLPTYPFGAYPVIAAKGRDYIPVSQQVMESGTEIFNFEI